MCTMNNAGVEQHISNGLYSLAMHQTHASDREPLPRFRSTGLHVARMFGTLFDSDEAGYVSCG